MSCLNLSIPAFRKIADDFGETKIKFLVDSYFSNKIPTYEDFISDKNIKRALGILTRAQTLEELGYSNKKQISQLALNILKGKISKKNNYNFSKNLNITYRLFNVNQIGEKANDNFTWGIVKMEKLLNMESKIERAESKITDINQNRTPVSELKQLLLEYPELKNSINEQIKNC